LRGSFQQATVQDPPDGQWLPETGITKTGKSVGKLYEAVVAEWDKVAFTTPDGKKLAYTATLTTDRGPVAIELWPELAPNHVRSFVALARAGYYDGLAFDRAITRKDDNGGSFELLEGGCPMGTGEPNYGSIGYWLKPEFNPKATHEPGTVGASHGEEVESAACKFYINLSKAEWMDGSFTLFGKVTKGLDVVRAIHRRPVRDDGFNDRPEEPVVIQRVTIVSQEKRD
jgi:cyclophilin family peptidyl-prolyl cis-trans isomerase